MPAIPSELCGVEEQLLNYLEASPIVGLLNLVRKLNIDYKWAYWMIRRMEQRGLVLIEKDQTKPGSPLVVKKHD